MKRPRKNYGWKQGYMTAQIAEIIYDQGSYAQERILLAVAALLNLKITRGS